MHTYGQLRAAQIRSAGQFAFAVGYAGALLLVFRQLAAGEATVGDFVMVLALDLIAGRDAEALARWLWTYPGHPDRHIRPVRTAR